MGMNTQKSLGEEKTKALLCYVLGWITGIAFLIIEKESKFVRFHAMQSTITFIGFTAISILLGFIPFIGVIFNLLITIAALITWVVCMLKAYQGEMFKLPLTGDLAERWLANEKSS